MNNKKLVAAIVGICVAIMLVAFAIRLNGKKNADENYLNESFSISSEDSEEDEIVDSEKESMIDESEKQVTLEQNNEGIANGIMPDNIMIENDLYPVLPEAKKESSAEKTAISFPYAIPNTDLIIQNITSYDGIFLEDGSDISVSGITTILLENSGNKDIEYTKITLNCNGIGLSFQASDIPAGAFVVVQESSKASYQTGTYTDCSADVADSDHLDQSSDEIKVQENEDGSLTICNLTDSVIPCVRLFYKFYMEEENAYVGGITYTAKLLDLEAYGNQTITPSHYISGYSRVVMVRTYENQE